MIIIKGATIYKREKEGIGLKLIKQNECFQLYHKEYVQ